MKQQRSRDAGGPAPALARDSANLPFQLTARGRALLLLLGIAFLARLPCFQGDFVYDDEKVIQDHPVVLLKRPLHHAFQLDYWGTPISNPYSHGSWRPLTILLLALCSRVSALLTGQAAPAQPWVYRQLNFTFHALNTLLVFLLAETFQRHCSWLVSIALGEPAEGQEGSGAAGLASLGKLVTASGVSKQEGKSSGRQRLLSTSPSFASSVLHALSSSVRKLLQLLLGNDSLRAVALPFLSSALFTLHPVLSEAVCNIACVADVLGSFFALLSVLAAVRLAGLLWQGYSSWAARDALSRRREHASFAELLKRHPKERLGEGAPALTEGKEKEKEEEEEEQVGGKAALPSTSSSSSASWPITRLLQQAPSMAAPLFLLSIASSMLAVLAKETGIMALGINFLLFLLLALLSALEAARVEMAVRAQPSLFLPFFLKQMQPEAEAVVERTEEDELLAGTALQRVEQEQQDKQQKQEVKQQGGVKKHASSTSASSKKAAAPPTAAAPTSAVRPAAAGAVRPSLEVAAPALLAALPPHQRALRPFFIACALTAAAFLLSAVAMLALRIAIQGVRLPVFSPADNSLIGLRGLPKLLTWAFLVARHLRLIIWPHPLAADWSFLSLPPILSLAGSWQELKLNVQSMVVLGRVAVIPVVLLLLPLLQKMKLLAAGEQTVLHLDAGAAPSAATGKASPQAGGGSGSGSGSRMTSVQNGSAAADSAASAPAAGTGLLYPQTDREASSSGLKLLSREEREEADYQLALQLHEEEEKKKGAVSTTTASGFSRPAGGPPSQLRHRGRQESRGKESAAKATVAAASAPSQPAAGAGMAPVGTTSLPPLPLSTRLSKVAMWGEELWCTLVHGGSALSSTTPFPIPSAAPALPPQLKASEAGSFLLLSALIAFLPASNLLFQVGFTIAERILYLPAALVCLALPPVLEGFALFRERRRLSKMMQRMQAQAALQRAVALGAEDRARMLLTELLWEDGASSHYAADAGAAAGPAVALPNIIPAAPTPALAPVPAGKKAAAGKGSSQAATAPQPASPAASAGAAPSQQSLQAFLKRLPSSVQMLGGMLESLLRKLAPLIILSLLSAACWRSMTRAEEWSSPMKLWTADTRTNPASAKMWYSLAHAHLSAGNAAEAERIFEVSLSKLPQLDKFPHIPAAETLFPDLAIALANAGYERGRPDVSLQRLKEELLHKVAFLDAAEACILQENAAVLQRQEGAQASTAGMLSHNACGVADRELGLLGRARQLLGDTAVLERLQQLEQAAKHAERKAAAGGPAAEPTGGFALPSLLDADTAAGGGEAAAAEAIRYYKQRRSEAGNSTTSLCPLAGTVHHLLQLQAASLAPLHGLRSTQLQCRLSGSAYQLHPSYSLHHDRIGMYGMNALNVAVLTGELNGLKSAFSFTASSAPAVPGVAAAGGEQQLYALTGQQQEGAWREARDWLLRSSSCMASMPVHKKDHQLPQLLADRLAIRGMWGVSSLWYDGSFAWLQRKLEEEAAAEGGELAVLAQMRENKGSRAAPDIIAASTKRLVQLLQLVDTVVQTELQGDSFPSLGYSETVGRFAGILDLEAVLQRAVLAVSEAVRATSSLDAEGNISHPCTASPELQKHCRQLLETGICSVQTAILGVQAANAHAQSARAHGMAHSFELPVPHMSCRGQSAYSGAFTTRAGKQVALQAAGKLQLWWTPGLPLSSKAQPVPSTSIWGPAGAQVLTSYAEQACDSAVLQCLNTGSPALAVSGVETVLPSAAAARALRLQLLLVAMQAEQGGVVAQLDFTQENSIMLQLWQRLLDSCVAEMP